MRQTFCCFCNTVACIQHNSLINCTFKIRESFTCFCQFYFITANVNHKKVDSSVSSLHKMLAVASYNWGSASSNTNAYTHNTYTHITTVPYCAQGYMGLVFYKLFVISLHQLESYISYWQSLSKASIYLKYIITQNKQSNAQNAQTQLVCIHTHWRASNKKLIMSV